MARKYRPVDEAWPAHEFPDICRRIRQLVAHDVERIAGASSSRRLSKDEREALVSHAKTLGHVHQLTTPKTDAHPAGCRCRTCDLSLRASAQSVLAASLAAVEAKLDPDHPRSESIKAVLESVPLEKTH